MRPSSRGGVGRQLSSWREADAAHFPPRRAVAPAAEHNRRQQRGEATWTHDASKARWRSSPAATAASAWRSRKALVDEGARVVIVGRNADDGGAPRRRARRVGARRRRRHGAPRRPRPRDRGDARVRRRPARRRLRQRRRRHLRPARRDQRGDVGHDVRHQRQGRLLHGAEGGAADGQGRRDRPQRVGRGRQGQCRRLGLRREQGGGALVRPDPRPPSSSSAAFASTSSAPGRSRRRSSTQGRTPSRSPTIKAAMLGAQPDEALRHDRRGDARRCSSSPRTRRRSSPASTCSSTAASAASSAPRPESRRVRDQRAGRREPTLLGDASGVAAALAARSNSATAATAITSGALPAMPATPIGQVRRSIAAAAHAALREPVREASRAWSSSRSGRRRRSRRGAGSPRRCAGRARARG